MNKLPRFVLWCTILLSLHFLACDPLDSVDSDDDPTDTTSMVQDYPIEVIWKTPLHPDTLSHCGSMNPVLGEEKVFFSGRNCYGQSEVILGIKKDNGNKVWDYRLADYLVMYSFINPIFGDNYLIYSENKIHAIDLESGTQSWLFSGEEYDRKLDAWFYNVRDKPAIIMGSRDLPWQDFQHLVELDPIDGSITDTLTTIEENQKTAAGIANVLHHKYENGNDWLLFKNRSKVADFYAYDITGDSIVWSIHDINNGDGIVHEMPIIHEEKVIFSAGLSLLCYDLDNGNKLWEVDNSSYQVNLYQDKILCYSRGDISEPILKSFVHAYDVNSGNQIWKTEVTQEAAGSETFTVYDGKLYLSDGYIQCLNISNGQKLWKYRPPDYIPGLADYHSFESGFAIDKKTGYCYISDGVYALCLNLNEVK